MIALYVIVYEYGYGNFLYASESETLFELHWKIGIALYVFGYVILYTYKYIIYMKDSESPVPQHKFFFYVLNKDWLSRKSFPLYLFLQCTIVEYYVYVPIHYTGLPLFFNIKFLDNSRFSRQSRTYNPERAGSWKCCKKTTNKSLEYEI